MLTFFKISLKLADFDYPFFTTDGDAPDISSDTNCSIEEYDSKWDLFEWKKNNKFLKKKLAKTAVENIYNGSPHHMFFILIGSDPQLTVKARYVFSSRESL